MSDEPTTRELYLALPIITQECVALRARVAALTVERDALATALDDVTHEFKGNDVTKRCTVADGGCGWFADAFVHRTSRAILAELGSGETHP